ncbi:MAG: peptidoglycan DD-metalloendopeptidase family protein, partial [Dokdonella sp.]|uniref:peptidoglycan DD-metalloendopeptidase family protein n=1 Tax=Dokdonella sp. TaxID=2291710 RepID=UPI00326765CB
SMQVIDAGDGRTIATFAGAKLAERFKVVGVASSPASAIVAAGASAIVYVELDVPRNANIQALTVELTCRGLDGERFMLRSATETVDRAKVPVLAPPLKGGFWAAVHDPSWETGHRRVIYTIGGRARIPGRYAIDWVGVDAQGRVSHADPDRPSDAIGYGAQVFAGADAVVAAIGDGMQEATSIAANPAKPLGEGDGNYVVLQLSTNRFAFYEHLKPGSLRVRVGDRVRVGQVLGALGFSGDSTGPHLHMHVADCSSPLECEGVPFTIRGMTQIGRYPSLDDLGVKRWKDREFPTPLGPQWPGYNVVVRFQQDGP